MKLSTFFAILGFILLFLFGYLHEQAHVEIFKSYNIESKVEYFKDFPNWATYPEKPCKEENCKLAQDITDVVGYHLMPFYLIIFLGLFIMIVTNERRLK